MYRTLNQSLKEWKDSPIRQPLLLRGARQTGKTFLIEQFGTQHFKHVLKINFELEKHYSDCFNSLDTHSIVEQLEIRANTSIISGNTLLFLDEIQECPNAIQALRYFYEQLPELHVIGAGSLLEFALATENFSMPVGRVEYRYLYPMTFHEMLLALGNERLAEYLNNVSLDTHIPKAIHNQLLEQLRLYFVLGGMPRTLQVYLEHKKLLLCRQVQAALLNTYRDDFGKYASHVQQRYCERIFNKTPSLITQNFKYKDIDPDMDYRGLKQAIQLLFKAGILTPVYHTNASGLPLSATQVTKNFKLLFLDLGLVQAASHLSPELLLNNDLMQINRGALTEQFVGQHLLAMQPCYDPAELFYWKRDKVGSLAEIDYIINVDDTIIPIEVKSGANSKLKSLHLFMQHHQSKLAIKLSTNELSTTEKIWSVPLYMIEQLPRLVHLFL